MTRPDTTEELVTNAQSSFLTTMQVVVSAVVSTLVAVIALLLLPSGTLREPKSVGGRTAVTAGSRSNSL
ncbi:hypothetical protein [Nocardia sp. CNY236]|uniref:hypothetical protein n=1 Tax=Nocardia sp. CNY236 TaxID=1169152 RepID=UPI000416449E|nr:hypothetical protein [Nocardia sp. CNY236]